MADYSDGTWNVTISEVLVALYDREPTEIGRKALREAIDDVGNLAFLRSLVTQKKSWQGTYKVHEGTWKKLKEGKV